MSALIRESHANNQTPLFLSAGGGVIAGNVDIGGNLTVGGTGTFGGNVDTSGNLTAVGDIQADGFSTTAGAVSCTDISGNGTLYVTGVTDFNSSVNIYSSTTAGTPAVQFVPVAAPPAERIQIRSGGVIGFGTLNLATTPQTTLTTSDTPNSDTLLVGGAVIAQILQGIGPSPNTLINSVKNIAPAPISPAPAVAFAVDTSVATIVGGEYDVMTRGLITLASGVPDVDDTVNITLDAGTAVAAGAVWTYQFRPSAVNANGYWQIRDRIVSDAIVPSVGVSVQVFLAGASTAVYNVSQIQFDLTQVI